MNYKRNYIGKGTAIEGMNIVRVTIPIEKIEGLTHKFEGAEYLTFEIAEMQAPDKFGRTHTCYVNTREKAEEPAPAPKAKAGKPKKRVPVLETSDEEIPF